MAISSGMLSLFKLPLHWSQSNSVQINTFFNETLFHYYLLINLEYHFILTEKSLSVAHGLLNVKQKSSEILMNKTFDKDINPVPEQNNNDITRCNANRDIITQQNLNTNAPDVVNNNITTTAATNINHITSVKILDVSDSTQQKLIANCFTVSGFKKPNNDKLKSVYTAVGVTYVSGMIIIFNLKSPVFIIYSYTYISFICSQII